jgi:hypothetical protein
MRWRPIVLDLALVVVVWALILRLLRVQRARMGQAPALRAMRGYRVYTSAAIAAAVGFTWFATWLITDATGPHWLHRLSLPAAEVFLATGAILAGYAGWIGGP